MQKEPRGLLKILKSHRNLQESASKAHKNNLNNFKSNSELLKNLFKNFEDASEEEIKPKNPSGDLNRDQLEAEWAQLGPEEVQQKLSQHIIYDYV